MTNKSQNTNNNMETSLELGILDLKFIWILEFIIWDLRNFKSFDLVSKNMRVG